MENKFANLPFIMALEVFSAIKMSYHASRTVDGLLNIMNCLQVLYDLRLRKCLVAA